MWVYIWTDEWMPWANTVAYLKLEQNTNDSSWKWNNGTGTNITYATLSTWKKVASFNGSSSKIDFSSTLLNNGATSWTISIWVYWTFSTWTNGLRMIICPAQSDSSWTWLDVYANNTYWNPYRLYINNNTLIESPQYQMNIWKLLTITFGWGNFNFYTNWVLYWTKSGTYNSNSNFAIWYRKYSNDRYWAWYMSDFIVENKTRTAQEVADYYNSTKANYGL